MKLINNYPRESGVTLVELMVGMAVGFIVIGGIMTIYSNTAGSSSDTIRSAVLNQEMNAIMQLASNDLRRAGYWLDTNTADTDDDNPFTDPTLEYNLAIDTWDADSSGTDEAASTCILFAYDLNQDSQVGIGGLTAIGTRLFDSSTAKEDTSNTEIFGFRFNSTDGTLDMRIGGSGGSAAAQFNCDNGTWQDLNEPDIVTINSFSIDTAGTSCINISTAATPNDWTTSNDSGTDTTNFCSEADNANRTPSVGTTDVAVAATDELSEVRLINIILTGELTSDSGVTSSLSKTIRVRNNRSITGLTITVP